jgi:hypothetical protein
MPRDVNTVLGRAYVTHPPFVSATAAKQPSVIRKAPVMLFDPYSQQMFACTKPGDAAAAPDLHPVPHPAGGTSIALRVLQLALLSSVAVMIWFMLSILQTT